MGGHSMSGRAARRLHGDRVAAEALGPVKTLQRPRSDQASAIRDRLRQPPSKPRLAEIQPCLASDVSGSGDVTPAAMPCPASGAAESAMRAQAVAATMIAPATAMACRQLSAGTPLL